MRRGGIIAVVMLAASACHHAVVPQPESPVHELRQLVLSPTAALPSVGIHLTVYVVDAGPTTDGTWLEVVEPTRHDPQSLIVVYGLPVDAVFATQFKGQQLEMYFKVTGRTALPDGRSALRIRIAGMRISANVTTKAPARP